MRVLLVVISIFIIIGCPSCERCTKKGAFENFSEMVPDSLMDFFPKDICKRDVHVHVLYPAVLDHNLNYCGCFVSDKMIYERYKDVITDYVTVSPLDYSFDTIHIKGSNQNDGEYVMPEISEQYSPFEEFNLSENIEVSLLECGKTKLVETEEHKLPQKQRWNYSKGLVYDVSEEQIVYWLLFW